ncbi:unnamed protein product [Rotaria sp. Silwood1]|nr:unnamed protein product [Rotaria sp. Silwood1]
MGAPLAPVIADIFMIRLETTLTDKLTQLGICEWYRYVDDTFVLINKDANVDNILSILNDFHSSIKFTRKIENNDKLEFLDVQVINHLKNNASRQQFIKASIISMVNRALNICSTYKLLGDEFNEIRRFGLDNDYSLFFINTIIGIKLSQHHNKMITKLDKPIIESEKKKMYVEIPFIRSSTLGLKNKIKHLTNKLRPDLDIQFFFKPPPSIQTLFQTKDTIAKHIQLYEHGAPTTPSQQLQPCNHESDDPNDSPELRRSSRIKNKIAATTITAASTNDTNNDEKIDKSLIFQHEKETGHRMDWKSLLIKAYEPKLNKTTHSVPLHVFPDGIPKVHLPNLDH